MILSVRKTFAGALAAAALVGSLAVSTEANAAWRHHGRWGGGAPVAGIVGGLALGALAAGAANSYYAPGPYYAAPAYGGCHRERQPV